MSADKRECIHGTRGILHGLIPIDDILVSSSWFRKQRCSLAALVSGKDSPSQREARNNMGIIDFVARRLLPLLLLCQDERR